eukprot:Gregarina_sp_Poly_1__8064@NODE_463_length_8191_cov_61_524372_g377_i0_p2_GENE_NODE_463_length_8191_cov_61_524372_g377_i0NODE_463_length_8191_cov_61_524372_g377_i0_p2_ORF_typecomplete_len486_score65_99Mannitol_dh_C/PF08125_13/3_4e37Mannitol_dh/PF01232_23/2_4e093HCDH_N/PF02737_18/0_0017UDPG_MGDP_dh_N/PF03721_14/0_0045GFO_IDH_MocA/PF01408_22/0_042Glu_dehyd_C/PF16912_5/0_079Ldh_1_N/PF00056_23/0_069TrkA_N/PF02254_18/0_14F420_oxidored/PF03807_17/0_28F420_oxidored/PF03807_17/1e04Sacchrp_dh_NADP/PF03435_
MLSGPRAFQGRWFRWRDAAILRPRHGGMPTSRICASPSMCARQISHQLKLAHPGCEPKKSFAALSNEKTRQNPDMFQTIKNHLTAQPKPTPLRALHIGAGNIGRGFIGAMLSKAGVEVVMADVVPELVNKLNADKQFEVHTVSKQTDDTEVINIAGAVISGSAEFMKEMERADLLTTAVGPNVLLKVAPLIKQGLERRRQAGVESPINIIACENLIGATGLLKKYTLKGSDSDFLLWAIGRVGFSNCAVDRIVPPVNKLSTFSGLLNVTVEDFCEWIIDANTLVGCLPPIEGVILSSNLAAFVERKLLTVNTGHCVCAYLGHLFGYKSVLQAIQDSRIKEAVVGAMEESGRTLLARHSSLEADGHAQYIVKTLQRFENPYIEDSISRVGREPLRKLGPNDRLVKPLKDAIQLGTPHHYLSLGCAAALLYKCVDDPQAVELESLIKEHGPANAFAAITGLSSADQTVQEVAKQFGILKTTRHNLSG